MTRVMVRVPGWMMRWVPVRGASVEGTGQDRWAGGAPVAWLWGLSPSVGYFAHGAGAHGSMWIYAQFGFSTRIGLCKGALGIWDDGRQAIVALGFQAVLAVDGQVHRLLPLTRDTQMALMIM